MVVSHFSWQTQTYVLCVFFSSKAINKVYGCVIQRKDHIINKETGQYDEEEFLKRPDKYTSTFKTKVSYLHKKLFFCF
jgi:hypothetical protein